MGCCPADARGRVSPDRLRENLMRLELWKLSLDLLAEELRGHDQGALGREQVPDSFCRCAE